MITKQIGDRLLALRKKLNLTQAYLADISQVSQSNYSKYEKNSIEPNYSFLTKIIEKLEVNPEWLLFGKGNITRDTSAKQSINSIEIENLKKKVFDLEMQIADLKYDNSKLQSKVIQLSEELLDSYKKLMNFKINSNQ